MSLVLSVWCQAPRDRISSETVEGVKSCQASAASDTGQQLSTEGQPRNARKPSRIPTKVATVSTVDTLLVGVWDGIHRQASALHNLLAREIWRDLK